MEEHTTEAMIAKRLEELPADVRAAIQSNDLDVKLQKIGAAHALHIDQIATLSDETLLVMLGFSSTEHYTERIAEVLKVTGEEAHKIAGEVNNEVFMSIRESMKQFNAQAAATPVAATTVPPMPAVAPVAPTPVPVPPAPAPVVPVAPAAPTPLVVAPEIHPALIPAEHLLKNPTLSVPPAAIPPTPTPVLSAAPTVPPAPIAPAPAETSVPIPPPPTTIAPAAPTPAAPIAPVAPTPAPATALPDYAADPYREPIE